MRRRGMPPVYTKRGQSRSLVVGPFDDDVWRSFKSAAALKGISIRTALIEALRDLVHT